MTIGTETSGVEQAITSAGGQAALAQIIGCTQQNISTWKTQGFVPVEHVVAVEQATGIPRAKLIKPQIVELLAPPAM